MKKILFSFIFLVLTFTVSAQQIVWMNYANDQEREVFQILIDDFEKSHPGVEIIFKSVDNSDYGYKINAAFVNNNPPDIFYVGPENIQYYCDKKRLLNLTKYVEKTSSANFNDLYPSSVTPYRYDGLSIGKGDIWALPKDLGPFALGYNADLLKKNGIPLPDKDKPLTFDEFLAICKKVTKDIDGDGKNDIWGTGLDPNFSLIQFLWGNNGDFLDETKTKVTITEPAFINGLQFFADMMNKHHVCTSLADNEELHPYIRWIQGNMAFFPVAPWDLRAFTTLPFNYDLIPWPVGKEGYKTATWVGSVGYGVSSKTKYPEIAAEFALYLSAYKSTMEKMTDLDMQVPTLMSLAGRYTSKPGNPKNRQEYLNIIQTTGRSTPDAYTYNPVWYRRFFWELRGVLDGYETAENYCKRMQPKMQRLLVRASKKQKS